ncbi:MAG: ABC transporter permease [Deltaproteobacteria bacterium]|nr:ABC transporter permease [Deltaproteobacteria bacterium]
MLRYVVGRLFSMIPVLFGASIVMFLTVKLIPGDPALAILGPLATEEGLRRIRDELGLNLPLYQQYLVWLIRMIQGDFGISITTHVPVAVLVWPKYWNTLILATGSLVFAVVTGVVVGITSGTMQYTVPDRVGMTLTLLLANTPPFWLGLVLVLIFSLNLHWLPAAGMYDIRVSGKDFGDLLRHLIMPAIATGASPAAIIARLVRSSFLDVIRQDYITAVRAKGMSEKVVIFKHALRNSLPPIINIIALQIGFLLGGALFSEVVFSWPGIGQQLYTSINSRDFPVIQAAVLLATATFVIINTLTDVINMILDPKIRRA